MKIPTYKHYQAALCTVSKDRTTIPDYRWWRDWYLKMIVIVRNHEKGA